MEEPVERFALNKGLQSSLVEAQCTEDVGQGSYHFSSWGYLEERGQAFILLSLFKVGILLVQLTLSSK